MISARTLDLHHPEAPSLILRDGPSEVPERSPLLAILGPNGAGKTTLLHDIASQKWDSWGVTAMRPASSRE